MTRIRRSLSSATAFLFGLMATCLAIHALLPQQNIPQVSEKMRWFAERLEDYDTLFVGSSRFRRGIDPAVFDAELSARGLPTRSFNFGIDAMAMPELSFVVEWIAQQKSRTLRRLFIELGPIRWKLPELEGGTVRAVYWHTPQCTALAFEAALRDPRSPPSWERTPPILAQHLALMLANYGNQGRVSDFLHFLNRPAANQKPPGREGTGYFPESKFLKPGEAMQLAEKIAAAGAWDKRRVFDDPVLFREVRRLAGVCKRYGYKPYFIVAPNLDPWRFSVPGEGIPGDLEAFEFNDPGQFPMLYLPTHRFDLQHLNSTGAEVFSRLLARRVADHLSTDSASIR